MDMDIGADDGWNWFGLCDWLGTSWNKPFGMELQWIKHLARNFMEGNISWSHQLNEPHCPYILTLLLHFVMFLTCLS
jgi:hypothetical protein